jgi:hypothetical protein
VQDVDVAPAQPSPQPSVHGQRADELRAQRLVVGVQPDETRDGRRRQPAEQARVGCVEELRLHVRPPGEVRAQCGVDRPVTTDRLVHEDGAQRPTRRARPARSVPVHSVSEGARPT